MPTFATPEPIAVSIEARNGSIRLVATDRADTVVQVRPRDESRSADVAAAEQTRVDFRDGKLVVSGARRGIPLFRDAAVDIDIVLPARSRLHASLASADLRAEGDFGDVRVASASGNAEVDSVTGKFKASTASGPISLHAIAGTASIATASGDVTVGDLDGDLKFKAASGSLSVDRLSGYVKARSASGSVDVAVAVRGGVSAHASSGDVAVGIAEGTAVRLDIVTGSGIVSSELEPSDGPQQGDEKFALTVRSGSGDVSIRRTKAADAT
ncbi:DUF4097 family beta strand repeat-containing protein [Mycobacterium sp. 1081908.1]|uniref:DUF4097 family beta strand repeat-containing protein n=1 Tax=Mycobacterium sp. 1081908.1 TaxID=1834066 RepID=UPI0007FB7BF4|nr:DUF4097 family beta strand repeat-containing protein [Mycobacterium sp. 1081908.1]OBK43808.1 hypothetical protein A5655_15635 [Mycobacterium sp. 1081908.1]